MSLRQIHDNGRHDVEIVHAKIKTYLLGAAVVLLLLLVLHGHGWAQGVKPTGTETLNVNCVSGCSGSGGGGTSSTFGAAFPTTGTAAGFYNGGNMFYAVVDSNHNLVIVGSGTAGTPSGGVLSVQGVSGGQALPASQSGTWTVQQGGAPWSVSASGNFGVTQQTSPWVDSITAWGGGTLGAMAAYGTSPGAVLVPGVNAFVTNTVGVSGTVSVSNFPATQPVSGTVTANQGTTPWADNVTQFGSSNVVTGTGASGLGIPRVTVSSDSFPATQPISGTVSVSNFPSTQAVSGTVGVSSLPSIPTGANNIGAVTIANLPATQSVLVTNGPFNPVKVTANVTNFPATQAVSGTVGALTADALGNGVGSETFYNLPLPGPNQTYLHVVLPSNIGPGTATPVQISVIGGQTNDSMPQYQPMPEGTGGRSVIVEGLANGTPIPTSGAVTVASNASGQAKSLAADGAGNLFVTPLGLPKQPCNAVRTTNCQHF
jgi:hypothetical protein